MVNSYHRTQNTGTIIPTLTEEEKRDMKELMTEPPVNEMHEIGKKLTNIPKSEMTDYEIACREELRRHRLHQRTKREVKVDTDGNIVKLYKYDEKVEDIRQKVKRQEERFANLIERGKNLREEDQVEFKREYRREMRKYIRYAREYQELKKTHENYLEGSNGGVLVKKDTTDPVNLFLEKLVEERSVTLLLFDYGNRYNPESSTIWKKQREKAIEVIEAEGIEKTEENIKKYTKLVRDVYIRRVQQWMLLANDRLKEETSSIVVGVDLLTINSLTTNVFDDIKRIFYDTKPLELSHTDLKTDLVGGNKTYNPDNRMLMWGVRNTGWKLHLGFDDPYEKMYLGNYQGKTDSEVIRDLIQRFTDVGDKVLEVVSDEGSIIGKESYNLGREYITFRGDWFNEYDYVQAIKDLQKERREIREKKPGNREKVKGILQQGQNRQEREKEDITDKEVISEILKNINEEEGEEWEW